MIVSYCAPVPQMESIPNEFATILAESPLHTHIFGIPERYSKDVKNKHHWTSNYVWHHVLPKVTSDLKLEFTPSDYEKVPFITKLGDFSYHNIRKSVDFTFTDCERNRESHGNASVLRVKPNEDSWSDYHRLFKGAHRISHIINHTINSGRNLLVVGDSMTVPVIPILANYFDTIIGLDNRSKTKIDGLIKWNEITDILFMFTTTGWTFKKLWKLYLQQYLSNYHE